MSPGIFLPTDFSSLVKDSGGSIAVFVHPNYPAVDPTIEFSRIIVEEERVPTLEETNKIYSVHRSPDEVKPIFIEGQRRMSMFTSENRKREIIELHTENLETHEPDYQSYLQRVIEYLGGKITTKAVVVLGHVSSEEITSSFFTEHVSPDTKVAYINGDFWHFKDQTKLDIAALMTILALNPGLKKIFFSGCYGSIEGNILGSCVEMTISELKKGFLPILPGLKFYRHQKTILI